MASAAWWGSPLEGVRDDLAEGRAEQRADGVDTARHQLARRTAIKRQGRRTARRRDARGDDTADVMSCGFSDKMSAAMRELVRLRR